MNEAKQRVIDNRIAKLTEDIRTNNDYVTAKLRQVAELEALITKMETELSELKEDSE